MKSANKLDEQYSLKGNIGNIIFCIAGGVMVGLLLKRLRYTLTYHDEVLNIYISYLTAVMGKRHLVENAFIFSLGDLFNLPFVYIFYKVTDSTAGIVLFMRYVYFGVNVILSVIFAGVFRRYLGTKESTFFSLILITYAPVLIYSLWYDSAALFFLLVGSLLLTGSELRENRRTGILRYFSGIAHACMVYAYPLMLLVILVLLLGNTVNCFKRKKMKIKEVLFYWLPYIMGGITILSIFIGYVLSVGWENIYFFQGNTAESALSGRIIGDLMATGKATESKAVRQLPVIIALSQIINKLKQVIWYVWTQQKATAGFTFIMLIQWIIGLMRKGKLRILLIFEIIVVAFWKHNGMGYWSSTAMYAYYFFWAPFLYFYLDEKDKRAGKIFLLTFWITAIASFLAVCFTADNGMKPSIGLYSGAICTFLFMVLIVGKNTIAGIDIAELTIFLVALCNLLIFYSNVYGNTNISECDYLMKKGIFKGIVSTKDDIPYEEMAECFQNLELPDNATLYISSDAYIPAYIEGSMIWSGFDVLYVEERLRAGEEIETFSELTGWPDAIIMDDEDCEKYDLVLKIIIPEKYNLAFSSYGYKMYVKRI